MLPNKYLSLFASLLICSSAFAAAPDLNCTLTDTIQADGSAGSATNVFAPNTTFIYMICESDNIQKGHKLKSVWVADNTHGAAPDNYTIDESAYSVAQNIGEDEKFKAKFSISKPDKGWPAGAYHVDIYVDKNLVETAKFTVK